MKHINLLRYTLSILCIGIFVLLHLQCASEPDTNKIVPITLNSNEASLLQDVGVMRHAAFRMELNKDIQWAEFWVDYYYNGKFIEKQFNSGFSMKDRKRSTKLLLTQIASIPGSTDELWTVSITGKHRMTRNVNIAEQTGTTEWKASPEQAVVMNQPMMLFALCRNHSSTEPIDEAVFLQDPLAWSKLMKNQHVYIFRVQFKAEN
jgi:hypothetical protein